MLIAERETQIMTVINQVGSMSVRELAERCGVTEVTIRRDLQRLEEQKLLKRTHGGAVSMQGSVQTLVQAPTPTQPRSHALILAPIQHRAAHALKERALRNHIPLLAESSAQNHAIYLGPDNAKAAQELGHWVASQYEAAANVTVLDITQTNLPNTQARSVGFRKGLSALEATVISVDGQGLYDESYHRATDALRLHPEIRIIFGVNDDSVLGALQAYYDLGGDPKRLLAVNVGGEGDTILEVLHQGGPLKATLALVPERVGHLAVDHIVRLWAGEATQEVKTPYLLLTQHNVQQYYTKTKQGWSLRAGALPELPPLKNAVLAKARGKRIAFVIQYRTHEWYQNLAHAMKCRAEQFGLAFEAMDVNDDFAAEIKELKRLIGKLAASYVQDGDTIILDAGSTTKSMAQFLHTKQDLTVITNSLDVFKVLQGHSAITLKLTGGDFYAKAQSFIGRGAQLLLGELRADKAFLVAAGVSQDFGISSADAQEAEVRRAMMQAAKEVIVLADHTALDHEASARVSALQEAHTLITDAGVSASQSLALTQLGVRVIVAGRVSPT